MRLKEKIAVITAGMVVASAATAQNVARDASVRGLVIRNVSLVPMDGERIEPNRAVVIRGDRIVSIGPTDSVPLPNGATVVDGGGRYLVPGLTDGHVHLESWERLRPDFGDAALYLARGITSVVNLRGTPTFFDWKRRVQNGELTAPTIYTAGELVIGPLGPTLRRESGEVVVGPNVTTPEDAERTVKAQARAGADLIKYYGGLSRPAYLRLSEAARESGLPVVGHRPLNLGFDALLDARQHLAHVYMLNNLYFWPIFSSRGVILASFAAAGLLVLIAVTWWRVSAPAATRARTAAWAMAGTTLMILLLLLDAFVFELLALSRSSFFALMTGIGLLAIAATVGLLVATIRIWKDRTLPVRSRLRPSLAAVAALGVTAALTTFWIPMSWRATPKGVERMSRQLRDAGISVQTTLVAFESLVPPAAFDFMSSTTRTLHRNGVLLVAGTDALAAPGIVPGESLHRELALLATSGMTPYEVIRTATVNPARLLGQENEFGRIAVGMRADLVLVESNPLETLETLKRPSAVMVRGRWLSDTALRRTLAAAK